MPRRVASGGLPTSRLTRSRGGPSTSRVSGGSIRWGFAKRRFSSWAWAVLVLCAGSTAIRAGADDETVVTLPAKIEDVAVAGAGRYLVLKLDGKESLSIYDTGEKKVVKTLKLPSSEFVFGAGATRSSCSSRRTGRSSRGT